MTPAQIAAIRRLLGLTADQLGDELGINPRTVRGWEAGKYSPSEPAVRALLALRAEHDAELDELLGKAAGGAVEVPSGPRARSWYLALAARLVDRLPAAQIAWQPGGARDTKVPDHDTKQAAQRWAEPAVVDGVQQWAEPAVVDGAQCADSAHAVRRTRS